MTTRTVEQVQADAFRIGDQIDELVNVENPTQGQLDKLDRYVKGAKRLAVELDEARDAERAEKLETIRHYASLPGHIENEETTAANLNGGRGPEVIRRKYGNPWDYTRSSVFAPEDVRDRAMSAAEQIRFEEALNVREDDTRDRLVSLIEENDENRTLQSWALATSNPHYRSAFHKLIRNPQHGHATLTDAERAAFGSAQTPELRAMSEQSGAVGGFLVPTHLDPTILLSNDSALDPFRTVARVETITTNTWNGISSAGADAEWVAEAAEWTGADPVFGDPSIPTFKGACYLQASFEHVGDTNIGEQVGRLIVDGKQRIEATAFVSGNGTTAPEGLVTTLAANTATTMVAANTNAAFGAVDVFALDNALPARFRARGSWLAHWSIYNLVRQMSPNGEGSTFWTDLGPGIPGQLLGRNAYEASEMFAAPLSSATASSDNVLIVGDFAAGMVVVDRVGLTVAFNPLVIGENRRPTGEVGWAAYFRTGSLAVLPGAFRVLVC